MKDKISIKSKQLDNIEQSQRLNDRERLALNGYFIEPTRENLTTAYLVSRSPADPAVKNPEINATHWIKSDKCKAYLNILKERFLLIDSDSKDSQVTDSEQIEEFTKNFNKDYILLHLYKLSKEGDTDSVRIRALESLTKLNKDITSEETRKTKLNYYLPLKCSTCKLHLARQKGDIKYSKILKTWVPGDK